MISYRGHIAETDKARLVGGVRTGLTLWVRAGLTLLRLQHLPSLLNITERGTHSKSHLVIGVLLLELGHGLEQGCG